MKALFMKTFYKSFQHAINSKEILSSTPFCRLKSFNVYCYKRNNSSCKIMFRIKNKNHRELHKMFDIKGGSVRSTSADCVFVLSKGYVEI